MEAGAAECVPIAHRFPLNFEICEEHTSRPVGGFKGKVQELISTKSFLGFWDSTGILLEITSQDFGLPRRVLVWGQADGVSQGRAPGLKGEQVLP